LDKCSYYINAVRDSAQNPVLVFDTGDFLPAMPDSERAEYVLQALKATGYDAVVVGDQEFLLGESFFISHFAPYLAEKKTPLCWSLFEPGFEFSTSNSLKTTVLLNLANNSRKSCFRTRKSMQFKKAFVEFAVTGYIDKRAFLFFPEDKSAWFGVKSVKETVSNKNTDCLNILLSHSGEMTDNEIASQFPELDLIIGGHTQTVLEQPEVVGKTLIVQAGGSGRYVGRLDLNLDKQGNIADYRYELVRMTQDIPSHPAVSQIVEEYEQSFFKDKKPRPHIQVYPDSFAVVAAEDCRDCHQAQYDQWAGTMHSKAFNIIEKRMKIFNPDCLSCHTTGFGHKQGFVTVETTPQWENLSCTECHWVKREHISEPQAHPLPVTEQTCKRCHTNKNSPDFDYKKYLLQVKH